MLRNAPVKRVPRDRHRKWISDEFFDLIMWFEPHGQLYGFRLCYDRMRVERVLEWTRDSGYRHLKVDDQLGGMSSLASAVLVPDGRFKKSKVLHEFIKRSVELPPHVTRFVLRKIIDSPQSEKVRAEDA